MRNVFGYAFIVSAVWAFSWSGAAKAQASIAAENIMDSVVVEYKDALGNTQTAEVTLVRDARKEDQWYYVPSKPILATTKVGDQSIPQFSLLRYDFEDPMNPSTINRAGLLNFAVRLSLPPEGIDALKESVKSSIENKSGSAAANRVRLAALPINAATVSVFQDNKLVSSSEGTGIAPTFASQQMAFSLALTDVGTTVFDELLQSKGAGLRTAIQYSYYGLTPPAGFKVKINYHKAHSHYSKHGEFKARASYFGMFGASKASSTQTIREELKQNGIITVEVVTGTTFKQEDIDLYLQPILKRINDEVLDFSRAPTTIDPAKASSSSAGGYFGGAGYSVAEKNFSSLRVREETIDFTQQTIVERNTVASGFIGVGNYDDEVRAQLFTLVDATKNPSAYVAFPEVPLAYSTVDLAIQLIANRTEFASRVYKFDRVSGWMNLANGRKADRISFSLAGVEQTFGKPAIQAARFNITKTLRTRSDDLQVKEDVSIRNGSAGVEIENNVTGLRIKPSQVEFEQLGGNVIRFDVVVDAPRERGKRKQFTFQAAKVNGDWQAPPDELFLLPGSAVGTDVKLTIITILRSSDGVRKRLSSEQTVRLSNGLAPINLDSFTEDYR